MNKYKILASVKNTLSWGMCIGIVLALLSLSITFASNGKTSVPAKVTKMVCGTRMQYTKNGHACAQKIIQAKRNAADNFQLHDTRIPRR